VSHALLESGKMYEYEIKVLRVVDGDTVDAQIDLGFKVHHNIRVRLYGINAPESRTRDLEEKVRGKAATARLQELLDTADRIILKSHGVGKFGRCLGEITLIYFQEEEDRRESVVETMLAEGHGVPYFGGKRK
jgi:micrococcal nuclease|tara:strand:+ start:235 stop:633 length:399 start_codon:yes stop_codon:yes gene_type:complete